MTDYEQIKQKVKQLEEHALQIQNLMEDFFSNINIRLKGPEVKWETPTGDLYSIHQQLVLDYEKWYNQSHILIQTYYPRKEFDFRQMHDNVEKNDERPQFKGHKIVTYGISDIIQLKPRLHAWDSKEEILHQLIGMFRKQLAIIIALPEVIPLCKQNGVLERGIQLPKANDPPTFPSQTINITATSQFIDNSIKIQSFSQASDFIDKTVNDNQLKLALKDEVKEFECIDKPEDYMMKYQRFVGMLANHVTAFSPVLTFLLSNIPK